MKLYAARFIQSISQADIQRECGIYQPVLSLFENSGIDNLRDEHKKKIETYLKMRVDWDTGKESDPLSREELKDLRYFVACIKKGNGEKKTFKWLGSFDTARKAYVEAKKIIDRSLIQSLCLK